MPHRLASIARPHLLLASFLLGGCQQPAQPSSSSATQPPIPAATEHRPSRQEQRGTGSRRRGSQNASHDSAFDYYLLNLSWSPEFCFRRPEALECALHRGFTLHGLWPQRLDGSYPEHCSDAPGPPDPRQFSDLYPDAGLLEHEWQTHGTCSGLDQRTYFTQVRLAESRLRVPRQLTHLDRQVSMPPEAILNLFLESNPGLPREALALSCGNNFLTAVELCLDKQLSPTSCGPVRSCRASAVRIPPIPR